MNFTDLIIIYLACGAPLGVYHFVQNRNQIDRSALVFQSVLRFIFWIPFALQLVAQRSWFTNLYNHGFDSAADSDSHRDDEIQRARKSLEEIAIAANPQLSVFEFRESFDRYAGLTGELRIESDDTDAEIEIFRISGHTNKSVGANCLKRRNRQRLGFHQKLARRDLVELLVEADDPRLEPQLVEFADIVEDRDLVTAFTERLSDKPQRPALTNVILPESEIWKTEKQRPQPKNVVSASIRTISVKTNLSGSD